MHTLPQSSTRSPLYKVLVVLFILAIAAFPAIPNYVTGHWPWEKVPEVENLRQIKALQKTGLTLPGWRTLNQKTVGIGAHKWSMQAIAPAGETATPDNTAVILLRPQTWHRDLPQVDWMDINGTYQWTTDSQRRLAFTVTLPDSPQPIPMTTRFLRGWTEKRTYAVLQWYAWPMGGHAAPAHWFWADQLSQLRDRHRQPWVAVSILLPIQPLGDIETARSVATTLGQQVQSALVTDVFQAT